MAELPPDPLDRSAAEAALIQWQAMKISALDALPGPDAPEYVQAVPFRHSVLGSLPVWFDRAGNPVDAETFTRLAGSVLPDGQPYNYVGLTKVGEHLVSTVWLGVDVGVHFHDWGPPQIYETMVFPGADLRIRAATAEQARVDHDAVVEAVRCGAYDTWRATSGESMYELTERIRDDAEPAELGPAPADGPPAEGTRP